MGKYMDVITAPSECCAKITFDPYVPKAVGEALNLVWKGEGFVDGLGNPLRIEYHYKHREDYLISFLSPDAAAAATAAATVARVEA
jgi:hypothetical protein